MSFLFLIFGILLIIALIVYLFKNKIHINFKSFFKKGFKLIKDKFGCYCWCGKQGDGKTYSVVSFIIELCNKNKNFKVITNVESLKDKCKNLNIIYEPNFYKIINGFRAGEYDTNYIIFYDEIFTLLEKR